MTITFGLRALATPKLKRIARATVWSDLISPLKTIAHQQATVLVLLLFIFVGAGKVDADQPVQKKITPSFVGIISRAKLAFAGAERGAAGPFLIPAGAPFFAISVLKIGMTS